MVLRFTSRYLLIAEFKLPNPLAAWSKALVCGLPLVGIIGSNPGGGMDVCRLEMLRNVRWRPLRGADHSPREFLPSVVCPMSVIANPCKGRARLGMGSKGHKN